MTEKQAAGTDAPRPINEAKFHARHDAFNRDLEKAGKVFNQIRELETRIKAGQQKIDAATEKGVDSSRIAAAAERLDALRKDLAELQVKWQAPHFVYAWVFAMMRQLDGKQWPLEGKARIAISLPGVIEMDVALSDKPPF